MALIKVTFDNSTLDRVARSDRYAGQPDYGAYAAIHAALRSGTVVGFFSEAVVGLDGLGRHDKVDMVGAGRIESESSATGPYEIMITLGRRWPRKVAAAEFTEGVKAALDLGLRPLIGPRRIGDSLAVREFADQGLYAPLGSDGEFQARIDRIHATDIALAGRGVGRQRALALAAEYSARDGATGEWWQQGLGRARDAGERKKVHRAINEWADGEAIAAHVGYGHDVFCTRDAGRGAGQQAVLHPFHRNWLKEAFSVEVVSLTELAVRIAAIAT